MLVEKLIIKKVYFFANKTSLNKSFNKIDTAMMTSVPRSPIIAEFEADEMSLFPYICRPQSSSMTSRPSIIKRSDQFPAKDRYSIVRPLLMDKRIDPTQRADKKELLISAADKGHYDIVESLLERGADQNARNEALLILSLKGYHEIVELLLDYGADPNAEDGKPAYNAIHGKNPKVLQLLLDFGADHNHVLEKAVLRNNLEAVEIVINHMINQKVDFNSDMYDKAFRLATESHNLDMVKMLYEYADLSELGGISFDSFNEALRTASRLSNFPTQSASDRRKYLNVMKYLESKLQER